MLALGLFMQSQGQEYFTIPLYDVAIKVNHDASLDIVETIHAHFTEQRHGIIRDIPFQYMLQELPAGAERAEREMESGGYAHTILEDISVDDWDYEVSTNGDYKSIRIGSADKYVDGDQTYVIHYRILNAINFFKDHSELYFNVIGDRWNTTIDSVHYTVQLYDMLPSIPDWFVATGSLGSKENNTISSWNGYKFFEGSTTQQLYNNQGVTLGISFPANFLEKQHYWLRGIEWLLLPVVVFVIMFLVWRRWGKDDAVTVQTEYYPPENISPSVSGYIIDDMLDHRDLTALVPYWGAGGYLKIEETEKSALVGLIKSKEYTFIKLKDLPAGAMNFEKTLFKGIFASGNKVKLSSLKNVLYTTMAKSKKELEAEVDKAQYYVKGSRELGCFFILLSLAMIIYGATTLFGVFPGTVWYGSAFTAGGIIMIVYGSYMTKKTKKGTELYQKLLGFKEFIKAVEKDRLQEFLKQDEQYFDKILPYAIVFDMATIWKDKLKDLDIPPPQWYTGSYSNFNTLTFMNSLDNSMNEMSKNFYSAPSSSSSGSGGSFSGGGGFSGGGFGGGGGSSW